MLTVLSCANHPVPKRPDATSKGLGYTALAVHPIIKTNRDSCRIQELLKKAQSARNFSVMLFYSHRAENSRDPTPSTHFIPQSSENTRLWAEISTSSAIFRMSHTSKKTEHAEAFCHECAQETVQASVRTTEENWIFKLTWSRACNVVSCA